MGRGSGKGKAAKGANATAAASRGEASDVSIETQPRHYTYLGKLLDESGAAVHSANGKLALKGAGKLQDGGKPSSEDVPKGGGKHPGKDSAGKSKGREKDDESSGASDTKGTGKAAGKVGGKSTGKDGGKSTGKEGGKSAGKDGGKSPGKDGGKSPGKDGGKSTGKDGGKSPGKDGGKSTGKDGGKSPGKDGGKSTGKDGGKSAGKDGGKSAGKDGGKSPGKDGGKSAGKDGGKSPGKDGGKSTGKDGGKSPGKDGGKSPGKDGGKPSGKDGGKSPGKDGGKSPGKDGGKPPGKDGGKTKSPEATEPGSGKGRGPAADAEPQTPPPRIGSTAGLPSPNTGTPPTPPAKGKKGKGKSKAVTEEQAAGTGPEGKGAKKLGWDGSDHAVVRKVSFDDSGPADRSFGKIPGCRLRVMARELTDEEREQIQALSGPKDIPLQQRKALNEKLRFEFLKAFLLDKDLSTIVVEPYYEELSESKEKEVFEELPLCIIKERYEKVEGGANINRVGSKTKASMEASANKAERAAIAETLQGKVAGMHKPTALTVTKENKGQGKNKRKKELTEEEIEKKNFDKDLQSIQGMIFKSEPFENCKAAEKRKREKKAEEEQKKKQQEEADGQDGDDDEYEEGDEEDEMDNGGEEDWPNDAEAAAQKLVMIDVVLFDQHCPTWGALNMKMPTAREVALFNIIFYYHMKSLEDDLVQYWHELSETAWFRQHPSPTPDIVYRFGYTGTVQTSNLRVLCNASTYGPGSDDAITDQRYEYAVSFRQLPQGSLGNIEVVIQCSQITCHRDGNWLGNGSPDNSSASLTPYKPISSSFERLISSPGAEDFQAVHGARVLIGTATCDFEAYYMLYRAAYNRLSEESLDWGVTRIYQWTTEFM
ncbi:Cathelicidin-B1 [Symbiodinium microadriaticum]|uniref:Cathelicidin-B1 n=1 Tax=Symbiodinium microadriaticum TaxID=2951 RepID=A0A1Q9F313_SYMMI|nr:Cathelicidin-B1 [Symbiodinium microadriaticum]